MVQASWELEEVDGQGLDDRRIRRRVWTCSSGSRKPFTGVRWGTICLNLHLGTTLQEQRQGRILGSRVPGRGGAWLREVRMMLTGQLGARTNGLGEGGEEAARAAWTDGQRGEGAGSTVQGRGWGQSTERSSGPDQAQGAQCMDALPPLSNRLLSLISVYLLF